MKNIDISNPYIGPRPFQREEKQLFFGREKIADELLSVITYNKIVIFYAQSGAGKTSLLNAYLMDLLEQDEFKVFKIDRIGVESGREFNPENIFIFNTLVHISLNERVKKEFDEEDLSSFIEQNFPDLAENPFVIIFDQFEEIFTSHRDRWQDREGFFYQIKKLCENYPTSRILFSMREDYIGYLDSFNHIWNVRPYYFRLDLLKKDEALLAIKNPAELKMITYAENVAEMIVKDLMQSKFQVQEGQTKIIEGEFFEPVQLQIVCQKLWDSLKPQEKTISIEHLERIGKVEKVLSDFYEDAIHQALENSSISESNLRDWIQKELITPIETRGTVFYGIEDVHGIPKSIIDSLLESYLIRKEKRPSGDWISLSHDRFIEPIIQSNRAWERKLLEHEKQIQQQRAKKYKRLYYAIVFCGISFLIPILVVALYLFSSGAFHLHEKALTDYLKAKQSYNEQNYEKAEDYLLSSLQKEGTEDASLLLALTYKNLKENKKAVDQFNKTIQLAPKSADTYYEFGNFLIENGEQDEGYRNLIIFFQIDKRSPRNVLSPHQYTGFVGYYFKTQIKSADSSQRINALSLSLELARQRIQYAYQGKNPETGFDCAGFISYILGKSGVFRNGQSFNTDNMRGFLQTTKPQPMDLMFLPGANNTVLFYLGDFFGEKLCIGIGLTAIVDIINIGDLNYAYSFYRINYR